MKRAITSFERYAVLEVKKGLKGLVGKRDDEELNLNDSKKIGKKIANMEGPDRKKYVGIMNFLGASCSRYKTMWENYKRTRNQEEQK